MEDCFSQLWVISIFEPKHFTRQCSDAFESWWGIHFSTNLLSRRWKNFENWLAFGKVEAKNRLAPFFRIRWMYYLVCLWLKAGSFFVVLLSLFHWAAYLPVTLNILYECIGYPDSRQRVLSGNSFNGNTVKFAYRGRYPCAETRDAITAVITKSDGRASLASTQRVVTCSAAAAAAAATRYTCIVGNDEQFGISRTNERRRPLHRQASGKRH